jgi:hypothetical protein
MKRVYSVHNVIDAKFKTLEFKWEWKEAIGSPELAGSWFIYGPPKNGKTSFAMLLSKYLAGFRRVAYNSIEEGFSLSIKLALKRVNMVEVGGRLVLIKKEFDELKEYLSRHKSPDIIVIDSIQFMELAFKEYKEIKALFPHKLFIYVSHVEGNQPEGLTARKILRDSGVVFRIDRFKAFPTSRYGGGEPVVISKDKASELWGD